MLACWAVVCKRGGQKIFRNQVSYTVDNKAGSNGKVVPVHEMKARWGSRGIAPLILNLRARHIVWSCCSQSLRLHPGEITSDTHRTGGWVGFRAGFMIGKTSLDLAGT